MKNYFVGLLIVLLISCGTETVKENTLPVEDFVTQEVVQVIDRPINSVDSDGWEGLETDIEMVIFFYTGDSLSKPERKTVDGLKKEFPTLTIHEFYSDDKIAQVFLNDTLAFDLSLYMKDKINGFVLLKPGFSPQYELLNDSLSTLKNNFLSFYEN